MHLLPIPDIFHKKYAHNKKEDIRDCKVSNLQRFSKVLPNVGGIALFCRGNNPKTYLYHELGSKFFSSPE